ncbi:2-alkenal reductase (NADP(+)-dependent)-like [Coffea arabica]|uniref:2-alkenal reductase (NADP(+)-dependent)-like n=1 Tax=Coffea arabica TaxID=13443 RepID=A0ABM4UQH1_COFAR
MKNQSPSERAINFAGDVIPGKCIDGYGVGRVVLSGNPEKDDLVFPVLGRVQHNRRGWCHVKQGFGGLTAYAGFFELCKPKKGEKVFVSAASGSIGNLVGRHAKLIGCCVVGSAGSSEKVDLLKNKLGFDEAFNYKEETDLKSTLKRYFPDGIDIYFDNVGAEMLEAAVDNTNAFGRSLRVVL